MTISEAGIDGWLASLNDGDLSERRRAAEQRMARAQKTLAALGVDQRKRDTRLKIVLGGAVLAAARCDGDFRVRLRAVLDAAVTVQRDRALLGLTPLPSADASADALALCDDRR